MTATPAPHDHWAVMIETSGERIVRIETECLSGRELSPTDEATIRAAARHLFSFVGDGRDCSASFLDIEDRCFSSAKPHSTRQNASPARSTRRPPA